LQQGRTVTEVPDNVDLNWIARTLVAMRRDTQSLRDDVSVLAAILRRVDNNQAAFREELRALYELNRDLRARIETIEGDQ
jgi:hypothetical protein